MLINQKVVEGKWHELKGQAKKRWAKLSHDDLLAIEGDCERLQGLVERRYGYSKQRAKEEVNEFLTKLL